jgi:hypothetical protein
MGGAEVGSIEDWMRREDSVRLSDNGEVEFDYWNGSKDSDP